MLAFLLAASSLQAQSRDWQAVVNIAPGALISVKTRTSHGITCIFQQASEDELVCEPRHPMRYFVVSDFRFDRRRIREVRLERSDEANATVGGLIGAGVGATVGAAARGDGTVTRGGGALMLGGIGALVGGAFGREFHILHGEVVYKR